MMTAPIDLTDDMRLELDLMSHAGSSMKAIGARLGVSQHTVRKWQLKLGLPTSTRQEALRRYWATNGKRVEVCSKAPIIVELRRIREMRGVPQTELNDRIGVGSSAVQRWERGSSLPRLIELEAWANALGHDLVLRAR